MNILLVLSEYAISSSSDDPITRKWPKNLACAYLDHSKRHFWWILNNPTRVITWTSHGDYLVQSEYAVSSKSDAPKSRKWPKTVFWLFESFKKAFLRFLNDPLRLIQLPNHADHLVLSWYAISSQSDAPNLWNHKNLICGYFRHNSCKSCTKRC